MPAPGTLTYSANGLNVAVTSYGFGQPGVFGGPALDRVGNLDSQPDSYLDSVGFFDLTVVPVPEPSALAIACVAALLFIFRLRPGHRGDGQGPRRAARTVLAGSVAVAVALAEI